MISTYKKAANLIVKTLAFILIAIAASSLHGQEDVKMANKMGEMYFDKVSEDNLEESIVLLHKAIPWFEKAANWEKYVECFNSLVPMYFYTEMYDSCTSVANKAYDIAQKKLDESSSIYITAVAQLGFVYGTSGNYGKALQYNLKAVELERKNLKDKTILSIYYTNTAWVYHTIGDYSEAMLNYNKAYDIILDTLGQNCLEAARLLMEIASCHKKMNQSDIALSYYQQCIKILDKLERKEFYDQIRWYSYVDMAEIYLQKGNKQKVLEYANKALQLDVQYNLLEDYRTWAVLGKLYQQEGNFKLALENFQKQRKTAEVEYKIYRNHPYIALATANIASVYSDKKDYKSALKHYQAAIQAIAAGFTDNDYLHNPTVAQFINKSDALDILKSKSIALFAYYKTGKGGQHSLEAAHKCNLLLADLIQSLRQDYLAEGSKHLLSERATDVYEQAVIVTLELHRITGNRQYLEQAFEFAESNKAVLLFEAMRDQIAKSHAGIPDSLLERERDLQAEITFYEKKILENQQKAEPVSHEKLREWENKLFDLKEQRKRLNKLLEKQYPDYYSIKYGRSNSSIAAIREQLSDRNMALVEFMFSDKTGHAFFLTRNDLFALPIKDGEAIANAVNRLREIIVAPPTGEQFKAGYNDFSKTGHALFVALLKDGLGKLPKEVDRLVIVPDGLLNYLPFEVLLTQPAPAQPDFSPRKLAYLFEDYAISYHYSATLLANAPKGRTKLQGETAFLGYAPSFGEGIASNSRACVGNQLSNLTCNGKEVAAIHEMLKGRAVLSDAASTSAFLLDAPQYGILHLATHACIDESSPGLNKIFFTDGYLSQLELDQLKLNAALTVLSACNTGTGKLQRGEGVMSMARSFLLAGSASVLNSLWAVDDCATSDLMLAYYQQLKDGQPKDVALQKARTAYLSGADKERSHPYYWAAFVQFGDVEPLDFGGFLGISPMAWAGIGALVFGLFAFWFFKRR